ITYEPDMLMLDEPFSALDSHLKAQLQEGVLEMLKLYHGEVLMVTHSMEEVHSFCENLTVIDEGKSILIGNTKKIFKHPVSHKVARLIGCKNISKCQVLSSNSV